ncbi:hypothetical protein L2E82_14746 [Cichorium intybus]|uniref:Uncharacterized protein n=1 Tax=Cichorium intybus TaxID=13427 RepID=A0ACB9F1R7_CICIN|nr:hypothetical protein L2E82_14746 [Cichorium intybus]
MCLIRLLGPHNSRHSAVAFRAGPVQRRWISQVLPWLDLDFDLQFSDEPVSTYTTKVLNPARWKKPLPELAEFDSLIGQFLETLLIVPLIALSALVLVLWEAEEGRTSLTRWALRTGVNSKTEPSSLGIKAQVATIEQAGVEATQKLEAPVVIVTRASKGIGKAVALGLGKAGCKVGQKSVFY